MECGIFCYDMHPEPGMLVWGNFGWGDGFIPIGHIANSCWYGISDHFPFVELGVHIIMPNHVHGIVMINKPADEPTVETQSLASLPSPSSPSSPSSSNCVRNGGMEHTDASPYVTDTNTDAFYTDVMHCVSTHEHI